MGVFWLQRLATVLILVCLVQPVSATPRLPALSKVVRPASKLVLKNNPFAEKLLRVVALNSTPQWLATAELMQNQKGIANFVKMAEGGYIPTLAELEVMIAQLEQSALEEGISHRNINDLRSSYQEAAAQGIGLALSNGTALEIGDNVPAALAEMVQYYVSYIDDAMQEGGIEGTHVAVADIMAEASLEAAAAGEELNSAALQTGEAASKFISRYVPQDKEVADAAPTDKEYRGNLTLKQIVSQHRELQQQTDASKKMIEIVNEALNNLEELQAKQEEAMAQLTGKMAVEGVSREELANYGAVRITSRFLVRPMIEKVEVAKSTLYQQLLAGLADDNVQAKAVLAHYFEGERALSEAELQQVCLHTSCTVIIRPILAIERVLDEYQRLVTQLGDVTFDALSEEERTVFATALAVYTGKPIPEVEIEAVPPAQEETTQKEEIQEEQRLAAEQAATLERQRKYTEAARKQALTHNVEQKNKAMAEKMQQSYENMADRLSKINDQLQTNNAANISTKQIQAILTTIGFAIAKQSNHKMMETVKGNRLSIS